MYLGIFVVFVLCTTTTGLPVEPVCSSFDFELKTLETMLRTEHRVEKLMDDNRAKHDSMAEEFKQFKLEMTTEFEKLKSNTEKQLLDETEKLTAQTENRIQSVDNALALVKEKLNDMPIAFSVTEPTKSIVNGVPIFTTTITNTGTGYNMDTGVFTAPTGGLYLFLFTVTSTSKKTVSCYLKHNNVIKAYGRTYDDNSFTSASASVYLMLTKGDTVSLSDCSGWSNVFGSNYDTSFNGALIKQSKLI